MGDRILKEVLYIPHIAQNKGFWKRNEKNIIYYKKIAQIRFWYEFGLFLKSINDVWFVHVDILQYFFTFVKFSSGTNSNKLFFSNKIPRSTAPICGGYRLDRITKCATLGATFCFLDIYRGGTVPLNNLQISVFFVFPLKIQNTL